MILSIRSVHRRDSVSISKLSEQEIEDRTKLGLITEGESHEDDDESEDSEEWNDFDDDDESLSDDDDHDAVISERKSSVDYLHCVSSPPGKTNIGMAALEFSNVNSSNRRNPLSLQRISEDADEEATLQDDMDETMDL